MGRGMRKTNPFICQDCGLDTRNYEYYSIKTEIWSTVTKQSGMLCISCLEKRLGRELQGEDFLECPLNVLSYSWGRSAKLIDRLKRCSWNVEKGGE
jgi:hypothetical protein